MNIDEYLIIALEEDVGSGDITTSSVISDDKNSVAYIIAKDTMVLAGMPYVQRIFQLVDDSLLFKTLKIDGARINAGQALAKIKGATKSILIAERTALNYLQRLSGIATLTNSYVKKIKGLPVRIADTRKTAPGLRFFDKYAVRIGGGHNHRFGLYDGILIKDNHITAAGSIEKAVKHAKKNAHHLLKIEVEAKTISEVRSALKAGADVIMLDNMSAEKMRESVQAIRVKDQKTIIEASGNINLENVRTVAKTGVDVISLGALTHSAPAVDISLNLD